MNNISPVVQAEAFTGLTLYVQRAEIDAKLEEIKGKLVIAAGGNTCTILVPGKGSVTVTKPSEPANIPGEFKYVFNEAIFLALSPASRKSLMDKGVVTQVPKTKGGSSAAVRYLPNK